MSIFQLNQKKDEEISLKLPKQLLKHDVIKLSQSINLPKLVEYFL